MRILFGFLFLMSFFVAGSPANATQCHCRPDLPVESTGPGECRKVQNGGQYCRLDWNAGASPVENLRALEELRKRGFKFGAFSGEKAIEQAAASLSVREPSIVGAISLLMADSLIRYAPDRLPLAEAFRAKYSEPRYVVILLERRDLIEKENLMAGDRMYQIVLAHGCAQARDSLFMLMVKTRFAVGAGNCDEERR